MAIHLGYVRAGWPGLLVAGACFILPGHAHRAGARLGLRRATARCPAAAWLLYGVKPVIIAVVVQALWALGRTAVEGPAAGGGRRRGPRAGAGGRQRAGAAVRRRASWCCAGPRGAAARRGGRARAAWLGRCRPPALGQGAAVAGRQPGHALPHLPEDRRGALRQRLRAARLPAHRLRRAARLAHRQQLLDAVAVGQVTPGRCSRPRRSSATCVGRRAGARCWRRVGDLPARRSSSSR